MQSQLYGSAHSFFYKQLKRLGIELTVVDTSKPDSWKAALTPNTKVIMHLPQILLYYRV